MSVPILRPGRISAALDGYGTPAGPASAAPGHPTPPHLHRAPAAHDGAAQDVQPLLARHRRLLLAPLLARPRVRRRIGLLPQRLAGSRLQRGIPRLELLRGMWWWWWWWWWREGPNVLHPSFRSSRCLVSCDSQPVCAHPNPWFAQFQACKIAPAGGGQRREAGLHPDRTCRLMFCRERPVAGRWMWKTGGWEPST